jgi:ATP-binding cassette subfamily F protein uup
MSAPNVLLLDEPTNDLDIQTMLTLEDYLDGFGGCLVVVSHDRYFLDRTVEHIFRFEGQGRLRQYPGNYSAFLEARRKEEMETVPVKTANGLRPAKQERAQPSTAKRKLSFKEQKELKELETRIHEAERRQAEIGKELAANSSDAYLVHQLYEERETLIAQLARDLDRWSELAELA